MSDRIDGMYNEIIDKTGSHKVSGSGRGASVQPGGSASSGKSTGKSS